MCEDATAATVAESSIDAPETPELRAFSSWLRSRRPISESIHEAAGSWEAWTERLDRRVERAGPGSRR
jgi:hypothetical protein